LGRPRPVSKSQNTCDHPANEVLILIFRSFCAELTRFSTMHRGASTYPMPLTLWILIATAGHCQPMIACGSLQCYLGCPGCFPHLLFARIRSTSSHTPQKTNEIVAAALAYGPTFFDTAEAYQAGRSESALAVALKAAGSAAANAILASGWPIQSTSPRPTTRLSPPLWAPRVTSVSRLLNTGRYPSAMASVAGV
jgi:hypothetical protein